MKKRAKPKRKASEREQIVVRAEHLRVLLREFGLRLVGFDPGVSAVMGDPETDPTAWQRSVQFDGRQWKWLEPLLIELRGYRMANRVFL